jgi:hypothetical protein
MVVRRPDNIKMQASVGEALTGDDAWRERSC